jgi:hypothetical protein
MPTPKKTSGPDAFLRERARYLLAHTWCPEAANNKGIPRSIPKPGEDDYLPWKIAIDAAWVTGVSGRYPYGTIKSGGWKAAGAFLKR